MRVFFFSGQRYLKVTRWFVDVRICEFVDGRMCGYADGRMCGLVYGTGFSLGNDW